MDPRDFLDEMTLSEEKKALLALLLEEEGFTVHQQQQIMPREKADSPDLSFAQQRMWLLDQLKSDRASYNFFEAFHLAGSLNVIAIQQSLQEIIRRHEILRTTFVTEEGRPRQVIARTLYLLLPIIDLSQIPAMECELELHRLVEEEALLPFDLSEGSLMRASLIRLGEREHVLLLTMHHIISDGWSLGVLHRELTALYAAFSLGKASPLPELPIQYADFALWQRQWLQGELLEEQLSYWRSQLADAPTLLALPTDRPRLAIRSYRGAMESFSLPASLSQKLNVLSQQEEVTLFMTLLAAFQTLLLRYTGQVDAVVGSPIANRNRAELERLIGFFVNTLALRTNLSGDPSFRELLRRVQEVALGAYAHQDLPFERLVEELQPERNLSHHPIFQVMFALQNAPMTDLELVNLSVHTLETDIQTATFDLTLSLEETEQGLKGWFLYDTDLFEKATIERMIGHFQTLLKGIVADPGQHLSTLPLLTQAERHLMVEEWNATQVDYPSNQSFPQLFEAQMERTPETIAVVFEQERLTYRELNWRANQLAHYLQTLGVGPEIRVGIYLERSLEMMVAILGILKAGGAYVPLESSYPQERLTFILEDTQISVILTQQQLLKSLPASGARSVCLDTDWQKIARESTTNPTSSATENNLAYIIYTSGSTGRPKGVMITSYSLINYLCWVNTTLFDSSNSSLPVLANITFDAALKQLLAPLLRGTTVWLLPNDAHMQPALLLHLLATRKDIAINCVPTLWLAMLDELSVDEVLTELRSLFLGGEVLSQQLVQRSFNALPYIQLWNLYGPTEATANASAAKITSVENISIGFPIANMQIYLLDIYMQLVPIGMPGEIYIGGIGLARGYLNHPELTADVFVPNPFSDKPGTRLYKTGDLACYLPDGRIEYLGRLDDQVKIRGFRIELGEIEALLKQHPGVSAAVVMVKETGRKDKQLVAYVVGNRKQMPADSDLRDFLKQYLPDYMLPSTFVPLEAIPLTTSGKVDRRALSQINSALSAESAEAFVAPHTPLEEIVAGIWRDILGIEQVSIHDNFFALGGHSLLATQVISRLHKILRVELTLRSLFESPTIAELARRIEAATASEQCPPIMRASRSEHLPLSFAQQRLWFLNQLQPESPLYSIPAALRLRGQLNVKALEQSLEAIVQRHEVLRTTFPVINEVAVQAIHSLAVVALPIVDVRGYPEDERETLVLRLAEEEAQRPFDLARGPLLRTCLLRLGEQEHVLLLTMHHIISDGWSLGVFHRELSALYTAFSSGTSSPLSDLAIQYADYALWQRQWLQGEMLEPQLSYWRRQLAHMPEHLELPTDHPRPTIETFRGAIQTFTLPSSLSQELKILSQQEGVTLFMTLLAAFEVLLLRCTGQEDVVVGSPIASRTQTEIEGLIGFFVNTLVLRTNLAGHPTFRELLARVRETALGAYAHQDLPFEKLVEELQPERNLSWHPLFNVMFAMQNAPAVPLELVNLTIEWLDIEIRTATFDLTLSLEETEQGLSGWFLYNTDLFEEATIKRMVGHFQTLLTGIVTHPEQHLLTLPLLTVEEQNQILTNWNSTQATYPKNQCIHQLYEAQAARTPDAVAIVFGSEHLTYQILNQRANQLAHYLQQRLGVGPEDLAGIYLERSLEMIAAMLGILKAGAAYVPLDLAYPRERLAFMIQDAHVSVLLTRQSLIGNLPEHATQVVCLDTNWEAIVCLQTTNLLNRVTPEHLAYVIYTSGSTGTPKGVSIPHRAVIRLVEGSNYIHLDQQEILLQFAPISFDASTLEIWGSLLNGARLVIFPPNIPSLAELSSVLQQEQITTLWLTAGLFHQMVEYHLPDLRGVRQLLAGGDVLSVSHVQKLLQAELHTCLINGYGPTENTTFTCCYPMYLPEQVGSTVPIGRPISNTRVYVLDKYLQPVPIGVSGELYTAGDGLARGYLKSPELTAERFIPNPFSNEPGARLYKTGDLARYRPTGDIEFIGRLDSQVKLRGFRIELGEIEITLSQHPAIREAVVLLRNDVSSDKRLAAYIVAAPEQACTSSDLRHYLQQRLPDYMLPSAFVWLEEMPLTSNGKVDRRALPAPEQSDVGLEEAMVAPRSPLEEILAGLWREILGVERVGVHDNFFAIGGHSLLATQLVSRIRTTLQIELPLRSLFEAPTVAELTNKVESILALGQCHQMPRILPVPREGNLPLSFAQQRLWFLDQFLPDTSFYNIPLAIHLQGSLQIAALEQSLQELVNRHEILRTTFSMVVAGEPVQVIASALTMQLSFVELQALPQREREEVQHSLIKAEALRPFDLAQGPLMRATLLCLDKEGHVLLLTLHHIVFDGWSSSILYHELSQLYTAFIADQPSPLPELPIQYADFALWQRQRLQGEVLEIQLRYWKQQLAALSVMQLPTDHPRPAVETFRGAACTFTVPDFLSEKLKALCQREGVTLFMTLLAAFQVLLSRYTGQEDIVLGTPIANRNRAEIEGLIGFFVNTLVLRTDMSGNPGFHQLLRRVREVALGAYAHQDLPFEKLVEELHPGRDLSRHPLFQVMFILQNVPRPALQLGDLTLRSLEDSERTTAKFDLTLALEDTEQGLSGIFVYNADLFDESTISRMSAHFLTLLSGIAVDPMQRISDLPLLTGDERQQMLVDWHTPQALFAENQCIHELVEAQVERTPGAIAVIFEEDSLTFAELNQRANQVAHYLRTRGVGPDALVGIYMERSLDMMVGLLGILKAGGAYVPLDPAYPRERLAFIVQDTHMLVLLTQKRLIESLPECKAQAICLDADWQAIALHSSTSLNCGTTSENLAYVLYTSGSTGRPKGVAIEHKSVVTLLHWARNTFSQEDLAGLLAVTSICFDLSVFEFFVPLSWGGSVILARDALHLPKVFKKDVTLINTVPSALAELLRMNAVAMSVRTVNLAGEPLPLSLVRQIYQKTAVQRVFNLYGPTEGTTYSTYALIEKDSHEPPSIGRPVSNTHVFILDCYLRPVPIGVTGELYLGGAGLARGYLNRPELTAERFIPNPFSKEPGARLYKTGDLACYLPDGNIKFIGRIDYQVKLRGFRIELGEIEAALIRHTAVREAAVLVREDVAGDKRLVAYVVADRTQVSLSSELRNHLKKYLPDYMIPSVFVVLEAMPQTPNGKVDRQALPPPPAIHGEAGVTPMKPRTEMEQTIASVWREVLHRDEIDVHDNFFDLGGHSLLVVRACSKLRELLGIDIPILDMFEYPTISSLATYLQEGANNLPALRQGQDHKETRKDALKERRAQKQKRRTGQR